MSSIFRTIHTIKGTSGFLAFNRLEEVTHVGENMLSRLRDGELALTPARTSVLLKMVDTAREGSTSLPSLRRSPRRWRTAPSRLPPPPPRSPRSLHPGLPRRPGRPPP